MKTERKILLTIGIIILIIAIFQRGLSYEYYKDSNSKIIEEETHEIVEETERINKIPDFPGDLPDTPNKPSNSNKPSHKPRHKPSNKPNNKPDIEYRYPDMDKYIRKTEIPSCTGDFKGRCSRKLGKYIKKTKIPGCPRVPDENKYILKTSIQPDNTEKHKKQYKIDGFVRNRIINAVLDNNNFSTQHRSTGTSNYLSSSGLFPIDQCKFIDRSVKSSTIFNKI